jgi:hypothetical protein
MTVKNKSYWINIRGQCDSFKDGEAFIKKMKSKFENIKFKLGKIRLDQVHRNFSDYDRLNVPIMACLPHPHPNELSREVVLYANSLKKITLYLPEEDYVEEEEDYYVEV